MKSISCFLKGNYLKNNKGQQIFSDIKIERERNFNP